MFSLLDSLTLTAAFGGFLVGILVLAKGPHQKLNIAFAFFSFSTTFWVLTNFFFSYYQLKPLLQSQYAFGSLIMPVALIWTYVFLGKNNLRKTLLIGLVALLGFVIAYLNPYFIKDFYVEFGKPVIIAGPLFNYYSIFILGVFFFYIFTLFQGIRNTTGIKKIQLKFILLGSITFGGISMLTSFVFPLFKFIPVGPYDAQSSLFLVGFSAYAILKHKLFDLKVVATELLISLLWIFLLIRTLLASSTTEAIINGVLFVLMLTFGSLLIRSVIREVETREKIELLAADLKKANDRLTELDRQKSEFVSFATHQLRAPLTAMKGYTSLILEGDMGQVSDQAKQAVSRIFESANTLASIVDDYLNITRIELGTMKYAFDTVDLRQLVDDVIGELKPNIEKSKLVFSWEWDQSVTDFRITADRDKLKQVIANLIDNSVKYTPSGSVAVTLVMDKVKHHLVFMVKDTGIGIAPEVLPLLFKKFSRAENANKVNIKGTGLGLFVAKEIIDAHHGTVHVESAGEGKGSAFIVDFEPFSKA